jgi:serine/threonine-protein kinase SRK2
MPGVMGLVSACCGAESRGDRFGVAEHYRLVRCLGRGGEGEVWLACPRTDASADASTNGGNASAAAQQPTYVALKLLRRGLTAWQVEAVTAEVQCLLELGEGHCNILRPTELLLSRTHLALVTEYVPGGSLADYLRCRARAGRPLSEAECSFFFRQLVAALRFCHGRCIVYRDVKPENVLLDGGCPPTLRLCDFGVARRWGAAAGPHGMTTFAGTPGYFAPQVLGCMFSAGGPGGSGSAAGAGVYNGAAADVWSAGALLSELLLQRLPYDFDAFAAAAAPTAALSRAWERAKSTPWRDATTLTTPSGGSVRREPLSASVLELLDGMLHPDEHARLSLDAVAAHPWVCQPLDAAHERALESLGERQVTIKRLARVSGVYSRTDGDGVIAAVVQRASAHESMRDLAAAAADAAAAAASGGGAHAHAAAAQRHSACIRLRLEDVPRMQCPPSLSPRYVEARGGGAATAPPSPGGNTQRSHGGRRGGSSSGNNSGTFYSLPAAVAAAAAAAGPQRVSVDAASCDKAPAKAAGWWTSRSARVANKEEEEARAAAVAAR